MSNETLIYWITRLDALNTALIISLMIVSVGLALSTMFELGTFDEDEQTHGLAKKMRKRFFVATIALTVLLIFLPSKNDVILIVAGGATLDYVQKDTSLQKLPYQTTELISRMMDEKIEELKK